MSRRVDLPALDRAADRPPFRQVADHLRAAILAGELPAGARVPSEADLIDHYGVARMTVRQGLALLRAEGLVEPVQGRGVFVRHGGTAASTWAGGGVEQRAAVRAVWPALADLLDAATSS